jgi:hypothetical protein
MKNTIKTCLSLALVLGSSGSSVVHAAPQLLGVESTSNQVFQIDVSTAEVTSVGTITGLNSSLGSLERAPDGLYYGATTGNSSSLYRIDPNTWAATLVGSLGGFTFEGGLAISLTGAAWYLNRGSASSPELLSVDLVSGLVTSVGVLSGGSHDINGLGWRSDGMLVGVDRVTNMVVEIDPTNAQLTNLASVPANVGAGGGMVISGALGHYSTAGPAALSGSNELYEFDPFTGSSISLGTFSGSLNNEGFWALAQFQDPNLISFCAGDGIAIACPCANPGATGEGCANSGGHGASLSASGSSSVADDDLGFQVEGILAGQPVLLFVGHNAVNGGTGVHFGDGLRCAGGSVVRLGVTSTDASGNASWAAGLAAQGGWGPGDVRRFQAWYRDPPVVPCGSFFNLSNGIEVSFQ